MNDSATKLTKEDKVKLNARRYLADKIYLAVLGRSQPAKLRQIMKALDVEGVNLRLVRDVMAESDRFESIDRRWVPSIRFGNEHRPFERVLTDVISSAGTPLKVDVIAQELAQIYGRTAEHYEQTAPRFLNDQDKYFTVDEAYAPASWLLMPTSDEEDDVVFDNFLDEEQVVQYTEACPAAEWKMDAYADTVVELIKGCAEPVSAKIMALFAWRALGDDYDPIDFYTQVMEDDRILVLSNQKLYPAGAVKDWTKAIGKMAEELAALPMEEEEELEGPVAVTETDKEEIIQMILDKGSASAQELLDAILEVGPEESAYTGALESLREALKDDERIMTIGEDRWSKIIVFPDEVKEIPASLMVVPCPPYETPEGDLYDQEIEEEGFEGDLKSAIFNPLAEDVTDEDPARTIYQANDDSQRCVLKYHHKVEGTFPLCQINPDFFGTEPEIIPIVLIEESKRKEVFVNNATRLIYGLKDFYKDITEVSGAVFYIEKTAKPGEFRFRYDNEVDEQLHIDTNRSLELLEVKARFEGGEMPVYDVIKDILEQRKQGETFVQLVNEVSIVKRCSRLLIASILSSYHAFHPRGKSDIWQFDSKKESQGFNKTKRKYIKK